MTTPIKFSCVQCKGRLKAPGNFGGRVITCPLCQQRTPVPDADEEPGGYGVAEEGGATEQQHAGDAGSADGLSRKEWCPGGYAELASSARTALEEARALACDHRWKKALAILRKVVGKATVRRPTAESLAARKPSALCLARWAGEELEELQDEGVRLSGPMRQLLKQTEEYSKWGGQFTIRACGLCGKQLNKLAGRTKVNTAAGTAYLCCGKPTDDDFELVGRVDEIWQRLRLAMVMDVENAEATETMTRLPAWHRLLVTPDSRTYWSERVARNKAQALSTASFFARESEMEESFWVCLDLIICGAIVAGN
jgi:hypothetical protein